MLDDDTSETLSKSTFPPVSVRVKRRRVREKEIKQLRYLKRDFNII